MIDSFIIEITNNDDFDTFLSAFTANDDVKKHQDFDEWYDEWEDEINQWNK